MNIPHWCIVGVGGCLGAIARFGLNRWVGLNLQTVFPLATFLANFSGCFLIGLLSEWLKGKVSAPIITLFLITGFLGAFTTFSAFSLETIQLLKLGLWSHLTLQVLGTLFFCFTGCALGMWLGNCFSG